MKIFNQSNLLLCVILLLGITSCKKDQDCIKHNYDQPNAKCLVTHTEEDLLGSSVDIFYNAAGDPDSMSFAGFPVTIEYDSKDRLIKANFGSAGVHFGFIYKDKTFLPAVLNYYIPNQGGLIAVDSFQYNIYGKMIKKGSTSLLSPEYNNVETYEYDYMHNVTKVTVEAQNGGTIYVPGYTAYEITKYDNKPNFMAGNQWIKYILLHSELDPFSSLMFSKNNAVEYHWGFPGGYNIVTSTLEYNTEGFANKVHSRIFNADGITELVAFTRTSSSTCDKANVQGRLQQSPLRKSNFLPKNFNHLPITNTSK